MRRLVVALMLGCFLAWSWCAGNAQTAPQPGPHDRQELARPTLTPTTTGKPRPTLTLSPLPSRTPTRTPTPIPSATPTRTVTPIPSSTPTRTPTPVQSLTPTARPTLPGPRWQQYMPVVCKGLYRSHRRPWRQFITLGLLIALASLLCHSERWRHVQLQARCS